MPIESVYNGSVPERLDKIVHELFSAIPEFSSITRSQLKIWIERGRVAVNGKEVTKAGAIVKPHSIVSINPIVDLEFNVTPSTRQLEILFEDDDLMVINKPAGLAMHPGAGRTRDTLANAVAGHIKTSEFPKGVRPGIVHRLDMDTTGVVVVAKTVAAHGALSAQFAKKSTGRIYKALVYSTPKARRAVRTADSGVVDAALGRHQTRRKEIAIIRSGQTGRRAVTHWEVIERMKHGVLLKLQLDTGRTHQIRVHMTHIGSPVIGDRVYGDFSGLPNLLKDAAFEFGRQALHAESLEFTHPRSLKRVTFQAPPPADFLALVELFRKTP